MIQIKQPPINPGRFKGSVIINANKIYIKSDQATEYDEGGDLRELEFFMMLEIPEDINTVPGYHRTIVDRLTQARTKNLNVQWFGYGLAKIDLEKNIVLLKVDNLDHVFIEKI